ncbi:hypothetical protein [Paenibacillus flagellatus]|uniref:Uncharacterized protein n=1 Tax=Paenibacillus flagellatus TaxID=2211139 RepID=A0A2V5K524_9BACL|nr:hypothetical protein [Paenibacillus flagellatus]PYI53014.1 hypothetical protein DLM86_18620 [Paenibacillus flagellatus]
MKGKAVVLLMQLLIVAGMGLLLLFIVNPGIPIGWLVNPGHRKVAQEWLTEASNGRFEEASHAIGHPRKEEWIRGMQRLKEEGFYPIGFERLKVPHDRELGDGRVHIDFMENGSKKTYYAILTFGGGSVGQVCIFSPQTERTEAWNKLNCHY